MAKLEVRLDNPVVVQFDTLVVGQCLRVNANDYLKIEATQCGNVVNLGTFIMEQISNAALVVAIDAYIDEV